MLHLVSGINCLYLFINLILAPVPPFPTDLFVNPSLLPLLIHHSAHQYVLLSFTLGLKPTCSTNPTPVVSLVPSGLPSRTFDRTISSELLGFCL